MEYFKDVPGYEGLYKISNYGKIISLPRKVKNRYGYKTTEECFLKPQSNKRGYLQFRIYKNGRGETKTIHRLVMSSFRGLSKKEINHIDGNKLNNALCNLEYCTRSENIQHAYKNKLIKKKYGENHSRNIFNEKQVLEIFKDNRSDSVIAREFNCTRASVWNIKNGKSWAWLTMGVKK